MIRMGSVSGVMRFISHVPLGYYAWCATNEYVFVKKHAKVLLLPPLSRNVLLVEGFAGPGGVVHFFWNFFMWIPTMSASERWLFWLGVIDAMLVGLLATTLHFETGYVGLTHTQCNQVSRNETSNRHLILFERAWQTNVTDTSLGPGMCKIFLAKWYVGLVVLILYSISALANLSTLRYPFLADLINVFQWLPKKWQAAIIFYTHYTKRWTRYESFSAGIKLRSLIPQASRRRRRTKGSEKELTQIRCEEKLARVLSEEKPRDLLRLIAHKVDYMDLVNLSLVSTKIRSIMFPSIEEEIEDRQLRYHSCYGNEKFTCWTCGIQICRDCSGSRNCRDSTVFYHMEKCQTWCSKCLQRSLATNPVGQHSCSCSDGRRANYSGMYDVSFTKGRMLCWECNELSGPDLLKLREKRDAAAYKSLAQQPLACSMCTVALPKTGLQWWVCSMCEMECRDRCHPGWSRKLTL